jgi:uncharacterized protein YbjT (DUF2867 family)
MTKKNSHAAADSILVVGATGTIGSILVKQLTAAGIKPRALVRSREKATAVASHAIPVMGDLSVPESLSTAFDGAERVFILAPPTPEQEALERNALDAAVAAGAKRIVFLSNYGAAVGDDDRHFHVHGLHERLLASLGVDWTVLRPTRFMNYTPFVWSSVLTQGLLIEAPGEGKMTVIDPDDIAAVAVKALTEDGHEGKAYELTSGDSFSTAELAKTLRRALGRDIRLFEGGLDALRAALIASGAPGEFAPLMADYFTKVAKGFYKTTDTVGRLLDRPPRSYSDWLERNLPAILSRAA